MTWLWWAPLGAAVFHMVEEFVYPGGFARWDRSYRPAIRSSITPRLHVVINVALLLACAQVGFLGGETDREVRGIGVFAWLALAALLFSNALFHVVGTVRTRTRSPGVITGVLLYLPMAFVGYWHFVRGGEASLLTATVAAMLGGSYHFWAGWLHRMRARRPAG